MNVTLLIAAHFMSGQAVFSGMTMMTVAMLFRLFSKKRLWRSVTNILYILGILFVYGSATPWPIWIYVLWTVLAFAVLLIPPPRMWLQYGVMILLICLSAFLTVWEIPYRCSPRISTAGVETIYVLGDSLSTGAEPYGKNWPEIIQDESGMPVKRFSFGGATMQSILQNAKRIGNEPALVLLEIGGNDLLSGNPAFAEDLEQLILTVCSSGRHVILFELPLPPLYNRYGRAQRRLAREYGLTLIPKKHLASVLSANGATTDGLHLSVSGHKLLADHVLGLLDLTGLEATHQKEGTTP